MVSNGIIPEEQRGCKISFVLTQIIEDNKSLSEQNENLESVKNDLIYSLEARNEELANLQTDFDFKERDNRHLKRN